MTQLYTVVNENSGYVIASGLTAIEAMQKILINDLHDYEIRPAADGQGFELWTTVMGGGGNHPLTKSVIYSIADDVATATQEIAEKVIAACWRGKPEAFTDEGYAFMMAKLAEEEE